MTRDMSQKQFEAALKRNGLSYAGLFWFHREDCPGLGIPGVFYRDGRCAKRETIAHLIEAFDRAYERQERVKGGAS